MTNTFFEGQFAVIKNDNTVGHGFNKGEVVRITEVDWNGEPDFAQSLEREHSAYVCDKDFVEDKPAPRFKIGDVVFLKHIGTLHEVNDRTLDIANDTSDTGIRLATEDERRKHLGLPPVKRDSDLIEINVTITRKTLEEAVDILGMATKAYDLYSVLSDINKEENK